MYLINSIWVIGQSCHQAKPQQFIPKKKSTTNLNHCGSMKQLRYLQLVPKHQKISLKTEINKCKQKNKKIKFCETNTSIPYNKPQLAKCRNKNFDITDLNEQKLNPNKSTSFFNQVNHAKNPYYHKKILSKNFSQKYCSGNKMQPHQKPVNNQVDKRIQDNYTTYYSHKPTLFHSKSAKNISFCLVNPENTQSSLRPVIEQLYLKTKDSATTQNLDISDDQTVKLQQPHQEQKLQQQVQQEVLLSQLKLVKHSNTEHYTKNKKHEEPIKECKLMSMTSLDAKFIISQDEDASNQSDQFSQVESSDLPTASKNGGLSPFIDKLNDDGNNFQLFLSNAKNNWNIN